MPRQTRGISSDNDSLKENYDTSHQSGAVEVKMEKVNQHQAKVKLETAKRARARIEEGEEEEEAGNQEEADEDRDAEGDDDDENDDDEQGGSPKGRKRARVDTDGHSRSTQNDGSSDSLPRGVTLPRDKDGFIPGSIVRIQLRNFVTYDFVEFRPGPYLNMIIGPNGTGKSSIACAIALGLNFPAKVLGRAEEVHSYVKNGTDDGHIEIELKAPKGKPNLVIQRNISAKSKNTTFSLNGKSAPGREVTLKVAELNVQVSNLCSFLPQDKVSEFAMMSSQQLLRETQKAAGDQNLTNWHETLIDEGKEHRQVQEKIKEEEAQLQQMRERNEAIERDVERYRERKRIEEEIQTLEVFIPCATYRELLAQYGVLREEQRRMHQKVIKLKAKNAPAHELLNDLKSQIKQHEKAREARKKQTQAMFQEMNKTWDNSEKMEAEVERLQEKIENINQQEKKRIHEIRELEVKIQKMKEVLDTPLETEDSDDVKAEMSKIKRQRDDIDFRRDEFEGQINEAIGDCALVKQQLAEANRSLQQLNSVDVQKLNRMKDFHRDTADAILWIRQNRDRFRMEIIEPAMMTCTVPKRQYASAVESVFSGQTLKTFVAQCREDYDLLNELVNDKGALGRKAWIATWFRDTSTAIAEPPMTREELAHLGFDGYLEDFVDCPAGMRWYLKNDAQIHRVAVALNGKRVDVPTATQAVGRSGGASFIVGTTMNRVTRSKYGRRAISNTTMEIKQARIFTGLSVDGEAKSRLEKEIREHQTDIAAREDTIKELKTQGRSLEEETAAVDKQADKAKKRMEAIRKAFADRQKLQTQFSTAKNQHKQKSRAPSAEQERANIQTQVANMAKKRIIMVKQYMEMARKVIVEQMKTTRIGLEYLQLNANKAALEELCQKKDEKYNRAMEEFSRVDAEYNDIKKKSKEALNESRAALNDTTDEIRERYEESQNKRTEYENAVAAAKANGDPAPSSKDVDLRTSDEYAAELEAQQAQLELVSKTNPGVIEQFEKRKRDIEVLEKTVSDRQASAQKVEKTLKLTLSRWKPALEKLVGSIGEKFSAAFDRIGCAGEIRISENEDYDKWAIDILVKFRDEEKLQLLTGQRQSGGERSLTTILYLMSLTEEARAPFSLVDEINQGMDQRAERVVHDSMVDVTCKDDAAQYFLITPKLLPDLKYHERMKILCVNNGEWLPEETKLGLGNMMRMIEGYVNHQRGSASH